MVIALGLLAVAFALYAIWAGFRIARLEATVTELWREVDQRPKFAASQPDTVAKTMWN